jgi:hypothetical protein
MVRTQKRLSPRSYCTKIIWYGNPFSLSATSAKKAKTTNSFYRGILVRDKGLKHMRKPIMKISTFLGPEMAKSEFLRESVWRKYAEGEMEP